MPRSKLRRILQSLLMLAVMAGPLVTTSGLAMAETTEPGVTDYCVIGPGQNKDSSSGGAEGKAGDTIDVKVEEDPPSGDGAVRHISKAIADAIGADAGLVYAQMSLESADGDSAASRQLKNFGGIKYSGAKGESLGTNATDGVGGAYAKFDTLSAFASREAAILKRDGVDKFKTVQEYAHALKEKGYYEATEESYAAGMQARLQQYYGGTGGGTEAAASGGSSDSSDDSAKGAWHKGDDDFAPDSLDTAFTTGFDDAAPQQQQQDSSDVQVNGDQEKVAKQIFDFFTKKMGFSGAGAAAMVGNFQVESAFNPMASNGSHFGIAQWTADRLAAMNLKPGDSSSMTIENELKLVQKELNTNFKKVKDQVGNADDVGKATSIVNNQYEISGNAAESDRERDAKAWYDKFNGASIKADSTLLGATDAADAGAAADADKKQAGGAQCSNDGDTNAVSGDWDWPFDGIKGKPQWLPGGQFGTSQASLSVRGHDFHDGFDWSFGLNGVHAGSTVKAVHGGTVTAVKYYEGLDWYVWVHSPDGYNEVYQETFGQGDIAVKEGQTVKTGDKIGTANMHGHLHLGITKTSDFNKAEGSAFKDDGTWLNPVRVILKEPNPDKAGD